MVKLLDFIAFHLMVLNQSNPKQNIKTKIDFAVTKSRSPNELNCAVHIRQQSAQENHPKC